MPQVISRILSHTCSAVWTSACFALLLAMPAQANEAGAPQPSVGDRQRLGLEAADHRAPTFPVRARCDRERHRSGSLYRMRRLCRTQRGHPPGASLWWCIRWGQLFRSRSLLHRQLRLRPISSSSSFADPTACIGCSGAAQLPLNVATAANPLTTVITPADPGWNSFILALSDQKDSLVITSWCLYPTASVFSGCGKSGGGNPESLAFGAVGSFAGDTVDFVKVIITDASFTNTPTSDSESFYETFQFWGSGTPAPGPRSVPEPGILALLLPALAGLLLARRRRDGLPAVPQGLKSGE